MKITVDDILRMIDMLGVNLNHIFWDAQKQDIEVSPFSGWSKEEVLSEMEMLQPEGASRLDEGTKMLMHARSMGARKVSWGKPVFEEQAQYLENLEMEGQEFEPCASLPFIYDSPYNRLKIPQLKYYMCWRSAFRRGESMRGDGGYYDLLAWEIDCGVGVPEGKKLEMYVRAMKMICQKNDAMLDERRDRLLEDIRKRVIDQYVLENDAVPFWSRMAEFGVYPRDFGPFYEYDRRLGPGSFSLALQRAAYSPTSGKYIEEKDLPRLEKAYDAACAALFDLLEKKKIKGEIVLWGRTHKSAGWLPLRMTDWEYAPLKIYRQEDAVICAGEKYTVARGVVSVHKANPWNQHFGVLTGYILKRCEARMRIYDQYRYRLHPRKETFRKDLYQAGLRYKQLAELIDSGEVDAVIDAAADEALRPEKETLKVDFTKLDRIRHDAEIVRQELSTEQEGDGPEPQAPAPRKAQSPVWEKEKIAEETSGDTPMAALIARLAPEQRAALSALLAGKSPRQAAPAGVMAQAFFEEINDLAAEIVGDVIFDGEAIFEDYAEEMREILK